MNYYRRYIGDFQRDTGHLSLTEVGAYDRLLDHYYATEASLPVSLETLCRISRAVTREERDAVQMVAEKFFPLVDGERRNKRADHEIEVSRKARDHGKEGGRPRKTGTQTVTQTGMDQSGYTSGYPKGSKNITGSVHPPTTNHQPPAFNLQEPTTKPPKVKSAGRGSRLPAAWEPDAEQVKFCRQERPDLLPAATAARFRDYWIAQPGAKGVKLDWSATWRNWVRNEKRGNAAGQSLADRNRAAGEEAQRRFEEEQRERR